MEPNPEAIAWYLRKSETVLSELREEIRSLRMRGGQMAGFAGAVLALAGANVDSIIHSLHGPPREVAAVLLLLGFVLLIASIAAALRGTLLPELVTDASPREIANFTSRRFTDEQDLWRVHLRAIHGSLASIESMARHVDTASRVVGKAEYFFLTGLFSVGASLATLVAVTL